MCRQPFLPAIMPRRHQLSPAAHRIYAAGMAPVPWRTANFNRNLRNSEYGVRLYPDWRKI